MREIKFKQPITKNKVFTGWHYWGYVGNNLGFFITPLSSNDGEIKASYQYTGIKDKNGKEIYEGDIIAVNEYDWEEKENYEVKYCGDTGYPAFELSGWYQRECNGLSEISEGAEFQGEVIGNRFENPKSLPNG